MVVGWRSITYFAVPNLPVVVEFPTQFLVGVPLPGGRGVLTSERGGQVLDWQTVKINYGSLTRIAKSGFRWKHDVPAEIVSDMRPVLEQETHVVPRLAG